MSQVRFTCEFSLKIQEELDGEWKIVPKNVDLRDREDRPGVQMDQMLADFAEKNRHRFFDYGGVGHKFRVSPCFPEFEKRFEYLADLAARGLRIPLPNQSVKDYPASILIIARRDYLKALDQGPRFNPESEEFVPAGASWLSPSAELPKDRCWGNPVPVKTLARTSPSKVCGVHYEYHSRTSVARDQSERNRKKLAELEERVRVLSAMKKKEETKPVDDLERRMARLLDLAEAPVCVATPL
jgi:hypothetical protein